MNFNHIPISKLEEGFEKETKHIQGMIDASKTLFDYKHYTMSISTSILVLEELTKFRDILIHLREKRPIARDEWSALSKGGSHNTKLTKLFEDVQNEVLKMGEGHHKKVQKLWKKLGKSDRSDFKNLTKSSSIKQLKNLNIIKKECMYLDWKDDDWKTLETTFIPKGQSMLAEVLYYQNLLVYLEIVLERIQPTVSLDEQSPKFKAYQRNPIRKKISEIEKITRTKEFQEKIITAHAIMMSYSENNVGIL